MQFDSTDQLIQFLKVNVLSSSETADILDVSTSRLAKMVREGKIKTIRERPSLFLKSVVLAKKNELEELRKKYRPYDD